MAKITILGCGLVGSAIAADLSTQHNVVALDLNRGALDRLKTRCKAEAKELDLLKTGNIEAAIEDSDLVVNAMPGHLGYNILQQLISAGKDVADISFFPEDALQLHALAEQKKVTAIVDIGVAPGMDNIILGHYNEQMEVKKFECLVGGLPMKRTFPFEYKAPFSPIDVIEEYTRPARYIENSQLVVREALSDAELLEFDEIGTLEAFNTDGLRSIIQTMPHIPDMKEKTLRYPGHINLIKALKHGGFFAAEEIEVGNVKCRPLDFTSRILMDAWKSDLEEKEFTVMRVTVEGIKNKKHIRVRYDLYDTYDEATKTSSMARTTGYTCAAAANLILEKKFTTRGVFPPELVGSQEGCFDYFLAYLREREVFYRKTEQILN